MSPLDPITMLVWSAVFNGIVAVPLMVAMMIVVTNPKIMGTSPPRASGDFGSNTWCCCWSA